MDGRSVRAAEDAVGGVPPSWARSTGGETSSRAASERHLLPSAYWEALRVSAALWSEAPAGLPNQPTVGRPHSPTDTGWIPAISEDSTTRACRESDEWGFLLFPRDYSFSASFLHFHHLRPTPYATLPLPLSRLLLLHLLTPLFFFSSTFA